MKRKEDELEDIKNSFVFAGFRAVSQESSRVESIELFLKKFAGLRTDIPQFSNTWDRFAARLQRRAQIVDGNLANKDGGVLTDFDMMSLVAVYDVLVAESIICEVCPKLKGASRESLAGAFAHCVPVWLRGTHEGIPVLEVFAAAGLEGKKHEMDFEMFDFLATILLSQAEKEKVKYDASPTLNAMQAFSNMAEERLYRKFLQKFNIHPTVRMTAIKSMFDQMCSYVTEVLLDPSDEHHEDIKGFVNKIDSYYDDQFEAALFFLTQFYPYPDADQDFVYGQLKNTLTLRRYGQLVGDPWYQGFTDVIIDQVATSVNYCLLRTFDIKSNFSIPEDEFPVDYQPLRDAAALFEGRKGMITINLGREHPEVAKSYLPDAKSSFVFVSQKDGIYGIFVVFSDTPTEKDFDQLDTPEWKNYVWIRYAVDVFKEQPEVFVQVFDEENVSQSLKSRLVELTVTALQLYKPEVVPQESPALPPTKKIEIGKSKAKGPERTPGSGRKRKHTGQKQSPPEMKTDNFLAEIRELRYRHELVLTKETALAIQRANKFSDRQMQLIGKKIITYNAGGGKSNTIVDRTGPNGGRLIEIKSARFRILAEVNDTEEKCIVLNVVARTDLKESIATKR